MHRYFIKTPWWARAIFSDYVWRIPSREKVVYLTFDDGPHPTITPWVLDQLRQYDAKATFFCIGGNVLKYTNVFERLLLEDHAIGNHTFHHLNGWKTVSEIYLADVAKAAGVIQSNLFRPPYGKIKRRQALGLEKAINNELAKVIMWDVLSADFDTKISPDECIDNVLKNVQPGSIIVFHDSEKAFPNLEETLPVVLRGLDKSGYRFEKIQMDRP
ncbi:MAG: polysaccharide deacetylase family protein [Chitinophagaceae bacterium]|nr:MAG: polysaccharide deacetylase family protein [Chitinophagaceae bacterium]